MEGVPEHVSTVPSVPDPNPVEPETLPEPPVTLAIETNTIVHDLTELAALASPVQSVSACLSLLAVVLCMAAAINVLAAFWPLLSVFSHVFFCSIIFQSCQKPEILSYLIFRDPRTQLLPVTPSTTPLETSVDPSPPRRTDPSLDPMEATLEEAPSTLLPLPLSNPASLRSRGEDPLRREERDRVRREEEEEGTADLTLDLERMDRRGETGTLQSFTFSWRA